MRELIAGLFAAALFASPAFAQDKKGEMTDQQKRMGDCSKQASEKGMKGDDRNKFMSTCLKGGGDKTAACNAQADEKKLHEIGRAHV